jgi:hypothetical protein
MTTLLYVGLIVVKIKIVTLKAHVNTNIINIFKTLIKHWHVIIKIFIPPTYTSFKETLRKVRLRLISLKRPGRLRFAEMGCQSMISPHIKKHEGFKAHGALFHLC